MAATQQALLMASDNAVTVPEACEADPYYSCGPTNDPYWANVVLLLHGDGANDGATITDSSSYARASTAYRSGSKTVTTEKKFGTASITAAASTGSHQFSDSTDFALSGAFTFEFWIKTVVQANEGYLFAGYEAGSGGRYWIVNAAGTTLNFVLWPVTISLITLTQGQWTHIAISRDGSGYFRIFKDGVELYGATHAASYTGAIEFSVTNLALEQWTAQASFAGYLDDVRFTQGVARYTGNFNIPTAAFPDALETVWDPADPRTVLSLHADDVVVEDASCYQPKTVTLSGTLGNIAEVTDVESKFGGKSFSVPNSGASTTAGIIVTDHQDLDFGTEDFTIEMWAYWTANTYYGTLFYGTYGGEFSLIVAPTTGLVVLNYRSSGGAQANIATGVVFPLTTWQHVVVQRRGTNFEFYLNGVLGNTTAITGGASSTVNSSGDFYFGRTNASSALTWAGYIDEVRITKGVARYGAIAAPDELETVSDPYYANVDLLVRGNGAAIDESTNAFAATAAGTAQISTAVKKYGTGSLQGDGNGDWFEYPYNIPWTSSDTFTIEFWAYFNTLAKEQILWSTDAANPYWMRVPTGGATIDVALPGSTSFTFAFSVSTWYHIALVVFPTGRFLYIDGALVGANTGSVSANTPTLIRLLGATAGVATAASALNGHIDDFRITNGIARYPSAFDPATMPNCDSVVPGNIVAIPGTSPLTGMSVAVQQQSIGDQNGAVALSNTVIDIGPPLTIRVNRADVFAGNLTVSSVATDKTVALLGRSVTVSRGTLAVPAYPNLISVSTTTIEAVATGNTAKLTFTFFTDGTYTVVDQALTTRTSGTWIDTAQTNYSIPAISNQYRVVTINIFAGTSYTYSTLPFTLGTSFSVVIQNLASSTLNIFDFQLTISPTSTNPRYAEPYYYGTHRFKAVLSNDMS